MPVMLRAALYDSLIVGPCNSDGVPSIEWLTTQLSTDTESSIAMVTITNPGNPTGYLYSEAEIKQLASLIKKHDLYLIADEVYREFLYDGDDVHFSVMTEDLSFFINHNT